LSAAAGVCVIVVMILALVQLVTVAALEFHSTGEIQLFSEKAQGWGVFFVASLLRLVLSATGAGVAMSSSTLRHGSITDEQSAEYDSSCGSEVHTGYGVQVCIVGCLLILLDALVFVMREREAPSDDIDIGDESGTEYQMLNEDV